MITVFETPRLIGRQFTEDDASLILLLNSDTEVVKYLHEPILESAGQAQEILLNIILPQYEKRLGRWAVHTKTDSRFIGWCGLKYRPELDEIDLGFRFLRSEWGKGYATESALETLNYGFQTLDLKLITGRAHIDNTASNRVLQKIGMVYQSEGIVDDCPVKTYHLANPAH